MAFIVDFRPDAIYIFWSRHHKSMTDARRPFAKIKRNTGGHISHPFASVASSSSGETRGSGISVTNAA
jgi:hypothetical protein